MVVLLWFLTPSIEKEWPDPRHILLFTIAIRHRFYLSRNSYCFIQNSSDFNTYIHDLFFVILLQSSPGIVIFLIPLLIFSPWSFRRFSFQLFPVNQIHRKWNFAFWHWLINGEISFSEYLISHLIIEKIKLNQSNIAIVIEIEIEIDIVFSVIIFTS